jgi:hypothetical protein
LNRRGNHEHRRFAFPWFVEHVDDPKRVGRSAGQVAQRRNLQGSERLQPRHAVEPQIATTSPKMRAANRIERRISAYLGESHKIGHKRANCYITSSNQKRPIPYETGV